MEIYSLMATMLAGGYVEAILDVYVGVMGYWFFIIIYMLGIGMAYLHNQDAGSAAILALILSPIFVPLLPPSTYGFILVFVALGLMGLLYKIFR